MKTVVTRTIDGFEIVYGFDSLVLDPESTKKKTLEVLNKNDDYKFMIEEAEVLRNKLLAEHQDYHIKCRTNSVLREEKSYSLFLFSQEKIKQQIQEKVAAIIELKMKTFEENKIYFEPKNGEYAVDEDRYKKIKRDIVDLEKNEFLALDTSNPDTWIISTIQDNRGKKFFLKNGEDWELIIPTKLGEEIPDSAVLADEADEAIKTEVKKYFELKRIKTLSKKEKQQEFEILKAKLTREAALHAIELELMDEPDPKGKAKTRLEGNLERLEDIYDM